MPDLRGQAFWPGVRMVESCEYTLSHGIAPAAATMVIGPQKKGSVIGMVGDLMMTDGLRTLVIPRAKVASSRAVRSSGTKMTLNILDRRWRWQELGGIQGIYNQVDKSGLVRPYMRKDPSELAELCLKALGEVNYQIILPNVTVRPPVAWHYLPPAQALEALVVSLGCRVIYRLDTDTILIAPLGVGAELPPGHISSESLTLDLPERPDRVYCVGQAFRYQSRFLLEPRAKEWNGEAVHPRDVSYRPSVDPAIHQAKVTPGAGVGILAGDYFAIRLNDTLYEYVAQGVVTSSVADVTAGLKAQIDLTPQLPFRAVDETTHLMIFGDGDGTPFDIITEADPNGGLGSPTLVWELVKQGVSIDANPWQNCGPNTFSGVRATDRMDKFRATQFARDSVYKWFTITLDSPTGVGPLEIPGFGGKLVRKEQIVLQQTKAEQIVPEELDLDDQGRPKRLFDDQGRRKVDLFYDGHDRDKPASVYGSYFIGTRARRNTDEESEVTVPFTIDPERQLVMFSQPVVYKLASGGFTFPTLILEVAHNMRDADTNDFLCVESFREFPQPHFGTQPLYVVREDIQATVIGEYEANHTIKGVNFKGLDDAREKCDYYLNAIMGQYELKAIASRTYAGLQHIWLDGAIAQVTWRVGGGSTTQASRNSEHSRVIPPFPQRMRNAALEPIVKGKKGANPPFQGIAEDPGPGGMVPLHLPPAAQQSNFWGIAPR